MTDRLLDPSDPDGIAEIRERQHSNDDWLAFAVGVSASRGQTEGFPPQYWEGAGRPTGKQRSLARVLIDQIPSPTTLSNLTTSELEAAAARGLVIDPEKLAIVTTEGERRVLPGGFTALPRKLEPEEIPDI